MNTDEAPIVVLGLGKDGKARAAVFGHQDAEAAKRAVEMMGLKIGRAETPEAVALTKRLPQGKVFASGKGLLPLIKRDLLEKLLKLVNLVEVPESAIVPADGDEGKAIRQEQNSGSKDKTPYINAWQALGVGATCLCSSKGEGWFEAIITAVSADKKTLTLKWRDYQKLPQFQVKRLEVGVLAKVR